MNTKEMYLKVKTLIETDPRFAEMKKVFGVDMFGADMTYDRKTFAFNVKCVVKDAEEELIADVTCDDELIEAVQNEFWLNYESGKKNVRVIQS